MCSSGNKQWVSDKVGQNALSITRGFLSIDGRMGERVEGGGVCGRGRVHLQQLYVDTCNMLLTPTIRMCECQQHFRFQTHFAWIAKNKIKSCVCGWVACACACACAVCVHVLLLQRNALLHATAAATWQQHFLRVFFALVFVSIAMCVLFFTHNLCSHTSVCVCVCVSVEMPLLLLLLQLLLVAFVVTFNSYTMANSFHVPPIFIHKTTT